MFSHPKRLFVVAACTTLALAACTGAPTAKSTPTSKAPASYQPVKIDNCGVNVSLTSPPKAAVTLNQGATEVMLSLGLEDRMVGTAYLDDPEITKKLKPAYDKVKVLAKEYPSKEVLLTAKPDFVYASYTSAFTNKAVGTREELNTDKITTFLSPLACPNRDTKAPPKIESAWDEVSDIAKIFGVNDRAERFISEQKATLAKLKKQAAGKGKRVFWYDSGLKKVTAGGGQGGPQIILDKIGAENIFANINSGWVSPSWEKVVQADPDVIVFVEASWSPVKSKVAFLEGDPVLSKLKAVKNKAYVTIPFSETTPGIRLVDGAVTVANQISKF